MTILAIDPGNVQSAYVMWDGARIHAKGIDANERVRELIYEAAIRLCPPTLAIEQIKSYGMAVGESIFETCVWTGRFMQTWIAELGEENLVRIPRQQIKVHLCQSARAKDGNVRQALIDRIGAQGKKSKPGPTYGVSKDVWAALAVAVCAHDTLSLRLGGQR